MGEDISNFLIHPREVDPLDGPIDSIHKLARIALREKTEGLSHQDNLLTAFFMRDHMVPASELIAYLMKLGATLDGLVSLFAKYPGRGLMLSISFINAGFSPADVIEAMERLYPMTVEETILLRSQETRDRLMGRKGSVRR